MCKKVFLKTFGCQMNERDSEWMLGQLITSEWTLTEVIEDANLIIINTCSVRYHAEHRAISFLGSLRKLKKEKNFKIVLTGCTAEVYGEELLKRYSHLDGVFGPSQEGELIENIDRVLKSDRIKAVGRQSGLKCFHKEGDYRKRALSAFVSIMEGCNNFCTYCIVPHTRGRERSRPIEEIVDEVSSLKDRGCKEITLLGQNVNSYENDGFVKLLEGIDKTGIERVRFMTSHPKDADVELFKAMRDLKSLCNHLHLPLQSGSNKILKLMNRSYTISSYFNLVKCYRKFNPQGAITTDIIVGFPGEERGDFKKTLSALKRIGFDSAFIFKYSSRPETKAADFIDSVSDQDKRDRNNILLQVQREIASKKKRGLVGRSCEVLFESEDKRGYNLGRSCENYSVGVEGKGLVGSLKNVKITRITDNSLIGEIIE
ncbi:MAG: tRNA (N6-isopentenyl adenosine(37)-C2)-methylthiotransferase MiaB [Candidatus Kaelpia aquatica]|nr:tRNA (N6-isopentenyl adenosine(37)-C2)-methylthiotransferase MiaB [Candidatus Kaelpia aquatica]